MFVGVVANPISFRNFSGKIHLECNSSKQKTATAMSHHQRFSDDILHKWCNQKVRWKAIALLIEITMYENALLIDQLYAMI